MIHLIISSRLRGFGDSHIGLVVNQHAVVIILPVVKTMKFLHICWQITTTPGPQSCLPNPSKFSCLYAGLPAPDPKTIELMLNTARTSKTLLWLCGWLGTAWLADTYQVCFIPTTTTCCRSFYCPHSEKIDNCPGHTDKMKAIVKSKGVKKENTGVEWWKHVLK